MPSSATKGLKIYTQLFACVGITFLQLQHSAAAEAERSQRIGDTTTLAFSFEANKSTYDRDENISFTMHSEQNVYLYIYTLNTDGSYTLIPPNRLETDNHYYAHRDHMLPNQRLRFQADGSTKTEQVYALASTRFIELGTAKRQHNGNFFAIPRAELERTFAAKGIDIREPGTSHHNVTLQAQRPVDALERMPILGVDSNATPRERSAKSKHRCDQTRNDQNQ